ncbi:MAG: type IV pilus modification protein PilV [Burkholderiales bacterium]|jgi:type IV pilus assembly protein PilV|nr:type IV pilus modification protein PilV [Burkholderiales bacterium]
MNRSCKRIRSSRAAAQGVAMIEALIGMLLIALWLLSSAGLQASSLKFQKGAQSRLTAIALAVELSERMEANAAGARLGAYEVSITDTATTTQNNCESVACSSTALASYDLAQWTTRLTQSLILKEATVATVDSASVTTYTITIAWDEPRGRQTYTDTTSKTERMSFTTTKVIRNG